jgi:YVTN family beta-propeller protein
MTSALRRSGLLFLLALLVPLGVASSADAQPYAYVVGQPTTAGLASVVSVIDTSNNQRVATIPVGVNCHRCFNTEAIAIAPDIGRLYVANEFDRSVSVIDLASNTVVATLTIGAGPTSIVAHPTGSRIYVLTLGGSVSEVDTTTHAILNTTPLAEPQAYGMAITPDGAYLYVSTFGAGSVKVIATSTMSVTATIFSVGLVNQGVDISPDGARAYVAGSWSDTVSVIDIPSKVVVANIPVQSEPLSVRVTPDGLVYVANLSSGTVSIINTQTLSVIDTVAVGPNPRTLDFTPDGTRAYVATSENGQVIDTATATVTGTIPFTLATHGYPATIVVGRALGGNPPTAVNDFYVTGLNTGVNAAAPGVLANDHSNGGGPMTTQLVNNVAHGTLTLNSSGSFAYTPAPGFSSPRRGPSLSGFTRYPV